MVVWRPSVARMVYLHTGTMGVHHACLLSFEARSCHSRGLDLAGKLLPCPTHPTCARAPAGGRQEKILAGESALFCTIFRAKRFISDTVALGPSFMHYITPKLDD